MADFEDQEFAMRVLHVYEAFPRGSRLSVRFERVQFASIMYSNRFSEWQPIPGPSEFLYVEFDQILDT